VSRAAGWAHRWARRWAAGEPAVGPAVGTGGARPPRSHLSLFLLV